MEKMAGYAYANFHESIDEKNYDSTSKIEWIFPLNEGLVFPLISTVYSFRVFFIYLEEICWPKLIV